jgi:hypothetical protein
MNPPMLDGFIPRSIHPRVYDRLLFYAGFPIRQNEKERRNYDAATQLLELLFSRSLGHDMEPSLREYGA